MKSRKKVFSPHELWNPGAVEQWLEEEAAAGWRLREVKGWFSIFERAEPRQSRADPSSGTGKPGSLFAADRGL